MCEAVNLSVGDPGVIPLPRGAPRTEHARPVEHEVAPSEHASDDAEVPGALEPLPKRRRLNAKTPAEPPATGGV